MNPTTPMSAKVAKVECPCGSGSGLDQCCGPIIAGNAAAPTAEALMRSRYTAFVRGDLDHIENTQAKDDADSFDRAEAESMSIDWIGLEIFDVTGGGADDDAGTVDFAARFKKDGEMLFHRERSNFRREDGRWVYVDGEINPKVEQRRAEKVGRNQPCPCGSGKKFKKCCGA
jgi:SEC-C motif domain protein